ncbi:hypothetical protein ABPG74_001992 [Tetrahymena malaccensis]
MAEEKIKVYKYSADFIFSLKNYSEKKIQLEFESECVDDLEFIQQVGDSIGQLKHISEISLKFQKNASLKQEGLKFLFKGLELLNQLEQLEVLIGEYCFLEDQGMNLLIYSISSLIELRNCQFDLEKIPIQNMKYLSQLNNLDLKLNCCSLQSDYILFDQFKYLNRLQKLNIYITKDTKFGKQAAISLGSSLMHLKMLFRLDIILQEGCQIESEGAAEIGIGLGYLKNLTVLNLFISESFRVKEQIQQLKVKDLSIRLSFYQFSQNYLDEIILPAIKNDELTHFSLSLFQEETQEIEDGVFMQIARDLSKSSLLSLTLQFDDKTYENLCSDKYAIILKELWNSKTLRAISLYCHSAKLNKLKMLFGRLGIESADLRDFFFGFEKTFSNLSELLNLQLSIQIAKDSELLFEDVINGIGQLNKLQQLKANFGRYEFTDTGSYHFSQACSGLQNLIELNIPSFTINDSITLNGTKFLNEGFSKLKKLKIFECYFFIPKLEFSKIVEGFFENKCLKNMKIIVETQDTPNTQGEMENEEIIDQNIETKQKIDHQLTKMISYFDYSLRQQVFEISKFYQNFINLSNLNELSVFHNWDLGQDSMQLVEFSLIFKNLALAFQQFKKLQNLKIELINCQFDLEKIPIQNMKYLSQLNNLDLRLNCCSLQSDYILFDQFKYLNRLQKLNIYITKDTKFGKQAAISLGSSLMHLKMLFRLDIILQEGCQIESEGAAEIGTGLGYLRNLTFLTLFISESCKIDEIGAMKLGEGISKLFTLKEIMVLIIFAQPPSDMFYLYNQNMKYHNYIDSTSRFQIS